MIQRQKKPLIYHHLNLKVKYFSMMANTEKPIPMRLEFCFCFIFLDFVKQTERKVVRWNPILIFLSFKRHHLLFIYMTVYSVYTIFSNLIQHHYFLFHKLWPLKNLYIFAYKRRSLYVRLTVHPPPPSSLPHHIVSIPLYTLPHH